MKVTARRLLGGAAIAVTATAAMVAVTVPLDATGADRPAAASSSAAAPSSTSPAASSSPNGSGPASGHGTGHDPLTPDEEDRAARLALSGDRTLRSTSEDVHGRTGAPQLLGTHLADGSGSGGRRVEVLFYDYRRDTLLHSTVDLKSNTVERTERTTGAQPAPSWEESREALGILLDSSHGDGLRKDFRAATGRPLTDPAQLSVTGGTYGSPSGVSGPAADCGKHRCLRLFTQVKDGPWIDTRAFVIDLSDRAALRLP
ncbi:hypothetical protein ACFYNL_05435 [Streptomyces sp. NPDC007808]|uniref:hypothetical protein n=1 Tax=Streptomyces sp. NPDC007808 TaxID=3364779 RepID=UPI0036C9C0BC